MAAPQIKKASAQVLSVEPARVLITWELEPTLQDVSKLTFHIFRGMSPSELKQITAAPIRGGTLYEFVDYSVNLHDLDKDYTYEVRAYDPSGAVVAKHRTSTMDDLDTVGLHIVEENMFLHRWVQGTPLFIFKKRKDGGNCGECWDTVLKRVTKSNCLTCMGTGRTGGFYPPMEAWGTIDPNPKNDQVADWGRVEPNQTLLHFTNYPLLDEGDVVFEVSSAQLWRITSVQFPEKNRAVLLQMAALSAVHISDVEYKLQPSDDRKLALMAELASRNEEREF